MRKPLAFYNRTGGAAMKNKTIVLKVWAWIFLLAGAVIYLTGIFSGEFNRQMWFLFWGTSFEAMYLLIFSVILILMAVTVFLLIFCLNKSE